MDLIPPKNSALYLSSSANIYYLTGYQGSSGIALKTSNKIYLFTDQRYFSEVKKTTKAYQQNIKPALPIEVIDITENFIEPFRNTLKGINILEFEEQHLTCFQYKKLKKILRGKKIKLIPSANLIENFRATKSDDEINKIKKAQVITGKVLNEIKKIIKLNIEENELVWKIELIGRSLGANAVSFPPLVCFGKNSAIPHHEPNKTKLKKGHNILLDFGFKYQNYCSDMSRTFFTTAPTELQKKVYQTVLSAQINAIDKIKSGMSSEKADFYARNIIKKNGFGNQFTHSLGHGVGLDIHEIPNLSPRFKRKPSSILRENMVVTVEPGIYLEGKFGVRIEDMIIIAKDKNKNLTNAPKTIQESILNM